MQGIGDWLQTKSKWLKERNGWIWLVLLVVWKLTEDRALSSANAWFDRLIQRDSQLAETLAEATEAIPFITWSAIGIILLGFVIGQGWPLLSMIITKWARYPIYKRSSLADEEETIRAFPKGLFDRKVDFLDSMNQMGKRTIIITKALNKTTSQVQSHTRSVSRAKGDPIRTHTILGKVARDIDRQRLQLTTTLPTLEKAGDLYCSSFIGIAEWHTSRNRDISEYIKEEIPEIFSFAEAVKTNKDAMLGYKSSITDLMDNNYSSDLDRSCYQLVLVIDKVIAFIGSIQQTTDQIVDSSQSGNIQPALQSASSGIGSQR